MKTLITLMCLLFPALSLAESSAEGKINQDLIDRIEARMGPTTEYDVIRNAVAANNINNLALNREKLLGCDNLFNIKLETTGITNQKSSGRCWMFAGVNVLSPLVKEKLNLSDFEFSHSYLAFFDRLEKANIFLEQIIECRDLPLTDRKMEDFISSPYGDGGWWHYLTGLVEKYGLVPVSAMPETQQSSNTGIINTLTDRKLRAFAAELRTMHNQGNKLKQLRERKDEMLADIYKFLVFNYGQPPKEFVFRYETEDTVKTDSAETSNTKPKTKKVIKAVKYTPLSFYREIVGDSLPEFVALCDNPTKPYDKLYRGEWSRSIYENEDFTMLNLPVEKLKQYVLASLVDSQAVWFACDVGKDHYRDSALFTTDIYAYDQLYDMDFKLTKAERIDYGDGWSSHAMTIVGADTTDTGEPVKWLVKNSWGTELGKAGYWTMYTDWFDAYVYVVIINKKYLSKEDLKKLEQKPTVLPMWDVFSRALRNL
ncbi:MAG: aminopeptidase C [Candidatus Zixiibacteriota bacterium]